MRVAYIPPVAGEVFVAKQCAHCGKILPSDTTRYCTACGNVVASSRPLKRSLSEDPPAWMKQLETIYTNDSSNVPSRELRVRVWEQEETTDLSLPENGRVSTEDEVDVVDDLPTRPLPVTSSLKISAQSHAKSNHVSIDIDEEEVADEFPTNPLIASQPQNPQTRHISPSPAAGFDNGTTHHDEIQDISTRPHVAQPVRQTPPSSIPVPPLTRPERNKRTLLAIVLGLLFILLAGGMIAWIKVVQPFTVPEITKTTQTFQNTPLGVSLQYPQKWAQEVNKQNRTVKFYDDNLTDQVNITIVATGNQSINQYMSKTASSLGMTGPKTQSALSFASASWQQVQGNVQQNGAIYTATLLVTMHGEFYYTILQLAPSSTYALEDQLVFSKMRSSFQFLS